MTWFDREGELVDVIAPFVERGWRLLDVGAGNGKLSKRVSERTGARIDLCDVRPHAVAGMTCLQMRTPHELPCDDNSYDAVLMAFMLHHVASMTDQDRLLREAARVAKHRIILLEDTAEGFGERIANVLWDVTLNVPQGIPTPLAFRSVSDWETALKDVGMVSVHVRRFRGTWPILRMYTQAALVGYCPKPSCKTAIL